MHEPTPKWLRDKMMTTYAVGGTRGYRNSLEHQYYRHHKLVNGTTLRAKYRPIQDR
jgi:hypothetical protein